MCASSIPGPRIFCSEEGCSVTFARVPEMLRHLNEFHGDMQYCPEPGCPYAGTKRASRLRDHMMKRHPHLYNVALTVPQASQLGGFILPPQANLSAQPQDSHIVYAPLTGEGYLGTQSQQNHCFQTTSSSDYGLTTSSYPTSFGGNLQEDELPVVYDQPSSQTFMGSSGNTLYIGHGLGGQSSDNLGSHSDILEDGETEKDLDVDELQVIEKF